MNKSDKERYVLDEQVEAVLLQAPPRLVPPTDDTRAVREAVRAEWQSVVARRRNRRSWRQLAIAASLALAVVLAYLALAPAPVDTVAVASIEKSRGTIYVLGETSELVELANVATIRQGQVIQTGRDGALGLRWGGGGSLRVDSDTRLEFLDAESVFLQRGRVYFSSEATAPGGPLVIETEHGSLAHIGTQYMAASDIDSLVISVREGRVRIDGRYFDQEAGAGKQVEIRGAARPVVVNVPLYGDLWEWTEALSPAIDLGNRSAWEFLQWVGRETGQAIVYASADAEQLARDTQLIGAVETDPRTELRLRMMTTDLAYALDSSRGAILVRIAGNSGP